MIISLADFIVLVIMKCKSCEVMQIGLNKGPSSEFTELTIKEG